MFLGGSLAFVGRIQEAEEALQEVVAYSEKYGAEIIGTPAHMYLGIVSIAKGNMSQGLKMLEEVARTCLENERRGFYALTEYVLGKVYLGMVEGAPPDSLPSSASKKAEDHFNKAIEVAKGIGAKGAVGIAHLDLGLLYKARGKKEKARECISTAIGVFEQCEVETYLRQAKEALENLG